MVFEIQKHFLVLGQEFTGDNRPLGREDLFPNFEHAHMAVQRLRNPQGGVGAGKIQRYDDFFLCRHGCHSSGTRKNLK